MKRLSFNRALSIRESVLLSVVVHSFLFDRRGGVIGALVEAQDLEDCKAILGSFSEIIDASDKGEVIE